MTPEEDALFELLANLIWDYEATAYPPREKSKPSDMVAFLVEQRALKPSDLWPVIGSKGKVGQAVSPGRDGLPNSSPHEAGQCKRSGQNRTSCTVASPHPFCFQERRKTKPYIMYGSVPQRFPGLSKFFGTQDRCLGSTGGSVSERAVTGSAREAKSCDNQVSG